jgi:hypothetical protein
MGTDSIVQCYENTLSKSNLSTTAPYFSIVSGLIATFETPQYPVAIQGTELALFVHYISGPDLYAVRQADMTPPIATSGTDTNLSDSEPNEAILL